MTYQKQQTGAIGEEYAAEYLKKQEYRIIGHHVTSRWGELDLIAEKNGKISFIEVKTRSDLRKGRPYEAVNYRKLKHLTRTIQYYVHANRLERRKCQLDVIGILLNPDQTLRELRHYENVDF